MFGLVALSWAITISYHQPWMGYGFNIVEVLVLSCVGIVALIAGTSNHATITTKIHKPHILLVFFIQVQPSI